MPAALSLGFPVRGAGSNSGLVGCHRAGHGAVFPGAQGLAMSQLTSTSQAAGLREGKSDRPSQQRGSHHALLALFGVAASAVVSH